MKPAIRRYGCGLALSLAVAAPGVGRAADALRENFAQPPADCRPVPLIFVNAEMTAARNAEVARQTRAGGFGGLTIIPEKQRFLKDDYFRLYGDLLAQLREQQLRAVFYDTPGFPSGLSVSFFKKDRAYSQRRLDLVAQDTVGPAPCTVTAPEGEVVAAVAMNAQTLERVNLAASVKGSVLNWQAPAGTWKVMLFILVEQRSSPRFSENFPAYLPDYLNPAACDRYIETVYDAHARRLPGEFGKTITGVFFDDITLYCTKGCRTWTTIFNEAYRRKYGEDPALLYPALWMDIGPETAAARVRLHSFRAELLAEGWPRRVNEWCRAHGVRAMGHPAGNYLPMPVDLTGDMIQFYRRCDIPLLDMIFSLNKRDGFKVVSSAAANFDRPLTGAEVFGGFNFRDRENFSPDMLYRGTMEVLARGVNLLVPHAVWYDAAKMDIPPLLSVENPRLAADLAAYNAWAARCCHLLQGGRTVADIAILYPIAALQAHYHFDNGTEYGTFAPHETDYLQLGHWLTTELRRDFTFLHPETLAGRCRVEGRTLRLDNRDDWQQYRALILPAGRVISVAALRKAREFWAAGGAVLATGVLPAQAAEFGADAEVQRLVAELFGAGGVGRTNAAGGRTAFLAKPDCAGLQAALAALIPQADLTLAAPAPGLLALHKVKDGRQIYFLANPGATAWAAPLLLRGAPTLEAFDPHTGAIRPAPAQRLDGPQGPLTRVPLQLPARHALFLVGRDP